MKKPLKNRATVIYVGWATSMPFASINSTNPRTNPWNFHKKILRIGDFEKLSFFESAILIFFCFIPMKISHKLCVRMDGTQFLLLWWFTAKNERGNDKRAWVYHQWHPKYKYMALHFLPLFYHGSFTTKADMLCKFHIFCEECHNVIHILKLLVVTNLELKFM